MSTTAAPCAGTNLTILVGTLSRSPERRELPSGDELLALEITVRPESGPAESVPVTWGHPPAAATSWSRGQEVLVVGRVRRRFFRAGGLTQSRTEVVAAKVIPTRRSSAARTALRAAVESIGAALSP